MALFGAKETKEDKVARKTQAMMEKYGLEYLDQKDLEAARSIGFALMGNSLTELGTVLTGSGVDVAKLSYFRALIEQNWIIIRQLDRLNKKLEQR